MLFPQHIVCSLLFEHVIAAINYCIDWCHRAFVLRLILFYFKEKTHFRMNYRFHMWLKPISSCFGLRKGGKQLAGFLHIYLKDINWVTGMPSFSGGPTTLSQQYQPGPFIEGQLRVRHYANVSLFYFYYWFESERYWFVVPLIYTLISFFFYAPWPGIEPTTMAYWGCSNQLSYQPEPTLLSLNCITDPRSNWVLASASNSLPFNFSFPQFTHPFKDDNTTYPGCTQE